MKERIKVTIKDTKKCLLWCFVMVKGFMEDLKKAKRGERIVLEVLRSATRDFTFDDVSDCEECFHKGDIVIHDPFWSSDYYIDVKDDGCISSTGNLLAEHRVWYKDTGWCEGFMQNSNYDFVAYLSQPDKKIYILDFPLWQRYYQKHFKNHIFIPHGGEQTTDAFLMPLNKARKLDIVICELDYDYDEERGYFHVKTS